MQEPQVVMRSQADRIRHTIFFEFFGLLFSIPIATYAVGTEMSHMSVLAVSMAVFAMLWNWLYNILFDKALVSLGRSLSNRPPRLRALHAICFEAGFMLLTLPAVMWWLKLNFWQALTMDIGFALFYVVYGYAYNWCYDKVFPYKVVGAQ